mmetsp:Transcript_19894/g.64607  ORF Transcript_19894/g.64607 Transcript_19894/m.64607 type:complete len:217 (-) Transcript_19894:166-816(-)
MLPSGDRAAAGLAFGVVASAVVATGLPAWMEVAGVSGTDRRAALSAETRRSWCGPESSSDSRGSPSGLFLGRRGVKSRAVGEGARRAPGTAATADTKDGPSDGMGMEAHSSSCACSPPSRERRYPSLREDSRAATRALRLRICMSCSRRIADSSVCREAMPASACAARFSDAARNCFISASISRQRRSWSARRDSHSHRVLANRVNSSNVFSLQPR